jgi:hypothetical protein
MHVFEDDLGVASQGNSLLLKGVRTAKRILSSNGGTEMNLKARHVVSRRFRETQTAKV